ncbi:PREDICTED: uncharacterized protein LOC104749655 [Camelina sativa]|uniref:ATP-dependent DNA helicase n=1 Tax=Camelina sativa TaxID=90675 RepID=A0ABM0WDS0_CAMSA|nr:PREDICTED: uncharacterized protein LOC104749655 [Camelina sativa]
MAASYAYLQNIKPFKTSWKVQVRVLHTWKTYTTQFGETFDMVLADVQGTKIHASCKKDFINRFENRLTAGQWRSIENFGLSLAGDQFKPTSHRYKMTFMAQIVVDRIDSISDGLFLSLSRFDSVLSENLNPNFLIDIVGQVVNVGEMQTIDVNNKPTHKIDFELRDESDVRITCTLWASFADQIYAACQEVDVHRVICLLRFVKIRLYNDVRTISNAFYTSQLIINPDYVEVIEFMGKLPNDGLALTILEGNPNRSEYLDHGDPTYKCCYCGAMMWYDERVNKRRRSRKPKFSLCCLQGTVKLPFLREAPELIRELLSKDDALSRHFRENIRAYNMLFAFTSLGGQVNRTAEKGQGPKQFQLHGQNLHKIGSMKPEDGDYAKFSQLYIVDTENEVENRSSVMSKGKQRGRFTGKKRQAKDKLDANEEEKFHMRILSDRVGKDGRTYSMPTASEVAALIPGDFRPEMLGRDIVVQEKSSGRLQRISEVHVSYLAPQYPLIFPYGEDGFRIGIEKGFGAAEGGNNNMEEQGKQVRIPASFTGGPRYMLQSYYDAMTTCNDINKFISAEIPDKLQDPELYDVVKDCMIHGPCGAAKPNSPCMVDGKCSKFYPKVHVEDTSVGKDGYPVYRRRVSMAYVEKNYIKCDNRYVVPYNRLLSLRYRAHINVEWCNQSGSIKYLFKYINKGQDRVAFVIEPKKKTTSDANGLGNGSNITKEAGTGDTSSSINLEENKKDEVKTCFDCRYVSASEADWRLFKFPIQYRSIPVMKLPFHPPGKQPVYYKRKENIEDVLERRANVDSMFMAYLKLNQVNEFARQFTYAEIPKYFTWDGKLKQWKLRERGFSIGRINYVPQKMEAEYYMRILLGIVTGPKSDEDIRTYRGVVYDTYKKACWARGILEDDQAYIDSILEASAWFFGPQLRNLFTMMLLDGCLSRPEHVWETTWQVLSEDIENKKREQYNNPALNLTEDEKKNYTLHEIEELMLSSGGTLQAFDDMPKPTDMGVDHSNRLITEEKNYNRDYLKEKHDEWISKMTSEQRAIYEEIMCAVLKDNGGVFFVYGFGGTGKTFMWKTLSAAVRYRGLIAINVASSGIASLLLEGGRTAHSRFCIPINPDDFSMYLANMLKETSLIIWDEAPIMSRYCFENLDRSLSDIMRNGDNKPFGGKVVVFGGDFRQVLPVINGAGRAQIVLASLNSSYLWEHCKVLTLTKNMRLMSNGVSKSEAESIKEFSDWILAVGYGKIAEPNDGEALIDIPDEFLITNVGDPIDEFLITNS